MHDAREFSFESGFEWGRFFFSSPPDATVPRFQRYFPAGRNFPIVLTSPLRKVRIVSVIKLSVVTPAEPLRKYMRRFIQFMTGARTFISAVAKTAAHCFHFRWIKSRRSDTEVVKYREFTFARMYRHGPLMVAIRSNGLFNDMGSCPSYYQLVITRIEFNAKSMLPYVISRHWRRGGPSVIFIQSLSEKSFSQEQRPIFISGIC